MSTSPNLLKRNLKILKMYDSGDYGRKDIRRILRLVSLSVVNAVVRRRTLYESDPRAPSILLTLRQSRPKIRGSDVPREVSRGIDGKATLRPTGNGNLGDVLGN